LGKKVGTVVRGSHLGNNSRATHENRNQEGGWGGSLESSRADLSYTLAGEFEPPKTITAPSTGRKVNNKGRETDKFPRKTSLSSMMKSLGVAEPLRRE